MRFSADFFGCNCKTQVIAPAEVLPYFSPIARVTVFEPPASVPVKVPTESPPSRMKPVIPVPASEISAPNDRLVLASNVVRVFEKYQLHRCYPSRTADSHNRYPD